MDAAALHAGNRDAWDRTARGVYACEVEAHTALLRAGGSDLMPQEVRALERLGGSFGRAVHLQCSHGLDALGLLNHGAREVVGVDISGEMLGQAQAKSDALGARAEWVHSDVLETPHRLDGTADLVLTGKGALCWMMDLDTWAAVVARLLAPGGSVLVNEGHPLDFLWDTAAGGLALREGATYFTPGPVQERGFPYQSAVLVDPAEPVQLSSRVWTLGQTVTALLGAGLRIDVLEEHPALFWDQFPHLDDDLLGRLPHTFVVVASRPRGRGDDVVLQPG